MSSFRGILVRGLVGCAVGGAYTIAYFKVPVLRCWTGDVRTYQMRCFDKDFEPYFFAPAGLFEALLARIARQIHPRDKCGEAIVLCAQHVRFQFAVKADPPPSDRVVAWNADILDYATKRDAELFGPDAHSERTELDGSKHKSRHLFFAVDEAEDFLRGRFPRPYTLGNLARWYEQACDEPTRVHLLVLLGASRDPRAALILGNALMSTSLDIRMAAVDGITRFFGATQCSLGGNTESDFSAAYKWLDENGTRLRREERDHPFY